MRNIKESATEYEPRQTKNIADLSEVDVELELQIGTGFDKEKNKEFTYNYVEINGEEYRVPDSVLKSLKAILVKKPNLKKFSVSKTGEGLNTSYTVIPMD